jgi:hypothetical protein
VAEWLRRQTQVLVLFEGVSSNLTGCTFVLLSGVELNKWLRFIFPTPVYSFMNGRIAQSVERWSNKPLVMGSSPIVTTTLFLIFLLVKYSQL